MYSMKSVISTLFAMTAIFTASAQHFEMKPLPYPSDALAPAISQQTIDYHYGKHYAGYVKRLNELVAGTPFAHLSLEDLIRDSEGAIFNNAAQIWNHDLYFALLSPAPRTLPEGPFKEAVEAQYGSLEGLKKRLTEAALALFGSGWVWLAEEENGTLTILSEPNAGNPLRYGMVPLLGIDVWEHAYYLDYRNNRAAAIEALWPLVDWAAVAERYSAEQ